GFANSVVSLGGRLGLAFGQWLTPALVVALGGAVVFGTTLGPGWRAALVLFGAAGVLWSVVFWWVVRDAPGGHPWANRAEASLPGFVGCVGMFMGGFFTDWLIRRLGIRRGRLVPIMIATVGPAAAYLSCTAFGTAGGVVFALCVVTVSHDLCVPSVWAIAQDI